MTDAQLLASLLNAIVDTYPLDRKPELPIQVSVISPTLVFLWDAREDAHEAIAAAVASELGTVQASAPEPLVGVLLEAEDADHAAGILRATYPIAIGLADGEPPF